MITSLWSNSYFKYLPIIKGTVAIGDLVFWANPSSFPQLARDMAIYEPLDGQVIIQEPKADMRIWELNWNVIPKFFYDSLCRLAERGLDGSIAVYRFKWDLFDIDRDIKVLDVFGEPRAGKMPLEYTKVVLRFVYV